MIVVDASAMTNALTDDGALGRAARHELDMDDHWVAPEHLRVEVFSAIRGLYLSETIGGKRAREALDALAEAEIETVPTEPLLPRMWELRRNVSGYDAAYVVTAEQNVCPLVTADARLTRVRQVRCEVRLVPPP